MGYPRRLWDDAGRSTPLTRCDLELDQCDQCRPEPIAGLGGSCNRCQCHDPFRQAGLSFWLRHVKQWETFNSALPAQSQVPAPVDPGPLFSPNCNFISSKTSSTGANTYWFGDPTLIKQYGGTIAPDGRNANYVSWIQGLTPHWEFDKANEISKDVAYEVCTCVSSSSCQHLGP
jgi:hypothetical protein